MISIKNFFEVVLESTEWGVDAEDKDYANYISGAADMANCLIEHLNEKAKNNLMRKKGNTYE